MHTEYEVRVLEVDESSIIDKVKSLGGVLDFDRVQKRYVYDFIPKVSNKWIRLRTNGIKTTLTIKNITSSNIDGTQELEIDVSSFERCNLILKELGYIPRNYQENRRVQYLLNGVEVCIDSWPLIPTYMEIEGKSEESVYNTLKALGYSVEDSTTKDVTGIYEDYGYDILKIKDLRLEESRK